MRHPACVQSEHRCPPRCGMRQRASGFTLIELMIVVAVIVVLSMIALPSFLDSVRKSRRSDAFAAMTQIQQAQERWRANNPSYSADLTGEPADGGLKLADTTPSGYYTLALSDVGPAGYTVTATAASGSSQASDSACVRLVLELQGGNFRYNSVNAGDVEDTSGASRCWNR
jgi:type IV pilus assembly protein PilE